MRKAFLEFLASSGLIARERVAVIEKLITTPPEPIGTIAFRYGMISGEDIDTILDMQRDAQRSTTGDRRPFGEIAVELGLLNVQQVRNLLCVQQIRAATETAEVLALSGQCPLAAVLKQLGSFLLRLDERFMTSELATARPG